MKKYLFIGIAATAMLASCTNDEIVEMAPQKAISFSTFVNNSTRTAVDPSYTVGNIGEAWNTFSVWGYDSKGAILSNETVTYDTDWGYKNTAYWAKSETYNFYAIAPASEGSKATVSSTGISAIKDFTLTDEKQIDLLYATPVTRTTDATLTQAPGKVEMTFSHILSKVKFTFTNGMTNQNTSIKVSDIKITNAIAMGSASNTSEVWTWTSENESNDLVLNFGATAVLAQDATDKECAYEKLMIPGKRTYSISYTVELWNDGAEAASSTYANNATVDIELKAGNSYNLIATINDQNFSGEDNVYPIEFTVTSVNGWTENDDTEITVQ